MSQGDPAQFIVAGSIGDQRVRILVDTGATISFITSALVPMLRPKPEVKKSELSVVLGNSETQDTDHYVEVPLTIHSCVLPASLHLLALPNAFDIIVGLDWLALHDSHVHVRARSLEITIVSAFCDLCNLVCFECWGLCKNERNKERVNIH